MAYYTGSANGYEDLLNVLVTGCQAHGWSWSDGILSKGTAFVRPTVALTGTNSGIRLEGGTGKSGATLINGSGTRARLYHVGGNGVWPVTYHLHIGVMPDEVYLVFNMGLTDYFALGFGVSTLPLAGSGLWMSGNTRDNGVANWGIEMPYDGGRWDGARMVPAFFWASDGPNYNACAVQIEADGSWPKYQPWGIAHLVPLHYYQPSAWNGDAVLLPMQDWQVVAESKRRLLVDAAYARRVVMNNIEPGQVLQIGSDRWRVYPYWRKAPAGQGGPLNGAANSGNWGWAALE